MIIGNNKFNKKPSRPLWGSVAGMFLALSLLSFSGQSTASLYTPQMYSKHGAVYARDLVRDAEGNPLYIYVEYDETGKEVPGWEVRLDSTQSADQYQVMSAERYRAIVTQYTTLLAGFDQAEQEQMLLSRNDFVAGTYTTVDGQTILPTPDPVTGARWDSMLRDDTAWVVVAPANQRYSTDPDQLLLMQLPINPTQLADGQGNSVQGELKRTVLLMSDNMTSAVNILRVSAYNIGYRVGFFGTDTEVSTSSVRQRDDKIYGPLVDVPVHTIASPAVGITDAQGTYRFSYMLPPCPGFTFDYDTSAYIKLYFKRFNPQTSATVPYYLTKPDWDFCNGLSAYPPSYSLGGLMTQIDAASTIYSSVDLKTNIDFPVDIMVLSGRAAISSGNGPLTLGPTSYDGSGGSSMLERIAQQGYDLDGDGTKETTVLGKIITDADGNKSFIKAAEGEPSELQGVWLSSTGSSLTFSGNIASRLPDLTRLPDWSADFADRALLSEISAEDLADTDLYVFRESDGSLLMERKGLEQSESSFGVDAGAGVGKFFYSIRLVGSRGRLRGSTPATDARFSQWQMEEGVVNSSLYSREADHLRPGERVRLIAINRASGYMGIISVPLQAASSGSNDLELSFNIEEIELLPPNLKVWAERQSRTELGMTQGEINTYLVGSEGAGMSNDQFIAIYMEWLDVDGSPLPAELADYGYTARLARISAANDLQAVDNVENISVRPGKKMVLLRLPESGTADSSDTFQYYAGNEHFYVQVSGQPKGRQANFSRDPTIRASDSTEQTNMLQYRPQRFVPLLAPVFDEATTNMSIQAWNQARQTDLTINKPKPVYRWAYRPEYQFSVYDLQMRKLNRQDVDGQTQNILDPEQPVIEGTDESLQLLYSLTGPMLEGAALNTLDAYSYNGSKELVFVLGEEEVSATLSAEGNITFDNLDHIDALSAEDHISLRLYANNDTANVLWEYAMFGLDVAVDLNRNGKLEYKKDEYFDTDNTQPTDKTTKTRPYRFWVNNDLDVVNYSGEVRPELVRCNEQMPTDGSPFEQQCEQWDEVPSEEENNTSDNHLARIESLRDLEDFAPLSIHLSSSVEVEGYRVGIKAVGVGVNLFGSVWRDDGTNKAHDYMHDNIMAGKVVAHANTYNYFGNARKDGDTLFLDINTPLYHRFFDAYDTAHLLFEGVEASDAVCAVDATQCYLSVGLYKVGQSEPILERKVYLDLHDVTDFYETWSAGTAEPDDFSSSQWGTDCYGTAPGFPPQEPEAIHEAVGSGDHWIYNALLTGTTAEKAKKDKAILVHGWRMRDSEKKDFANTAFKRLYWLGYQGRFAAVNWPTGWFHKPAHCYGTVASGTLAGQNSQNYDQSEVVARLTGKKLEKWLMNQSTPNMKLHLIVHSMGNVVVSEALRHHASGQLIASYSASQAAEVGGSYDDALGDMQNAYDKDGVTAEAFWLDSNLVSSIGDVEYAMPPDIYRYTNLISEVDGNYVLNHQKTTSAQLKVSSEQVKLATNTNESHYYRSIADKVGRIVNFYNTGDAALTAWEFNQLTKPDYLGLGLPVWGYANEHLCHASKHDQVTGEVIAWEYPDGASCPSPSDIGSELTSHFYWDNTEISWDPSLPATDDAYSAEQKNFLNVMGYIIPARTEALGQVNIRKEREENSVSLDLINGFTDMSAGFTNSNQGHSAQFHGYLSEPERGRGNYWLGVMEQGMKLDPLSNDGDDYSGLFTDKLKIEVNQ